MADWYGTARSNHVRLKDPEELKRLLAQLAPEVALQESCSVPGQFVFLVSRLSDSGGWPGIYPLGTDGEVDHDADPVDFAEFVAGHLADGEVLVIVEAGAEKLRYVSGWARAVRMHNGRRQELTVSIEDIYRLVEKRWKVIPTSASS